MAITLVFKLKKKKLFSNLFAVVLEQSYTQSVSTELWLYDQRHFRLKMMIIWLCPN